jgi:glycosyltransferase involved in cell wall biosynthesis
MLHAPRLELTPAGLPLPTIGMQDAMASTDALPKPARVVVINDVSVARGGATTIALASAQLLAERSVPVTFLTGDDATGAAALPGVAFVGLGGRHIRDSQLSGFVTGLYNREAEQLIRRWIAANDTPDTIYHLHGWSKILSPAVLRALDPVAPRLVVNAHDFFLVCPNGGYFDFRHSQPCALTPMSGACLATRCDRRNNAHKLWRFARQGLLRALCDLGGESRVGAVLAVHDGMIEHLHRGGIARELLQSLRNPVLPWRDTRIEAERNSRFVFVGRLEADKGIELLARAARRANVPLRIIGHGPLAGQLASDFPEAEQVGWKTSAEIAELVADARALVMPSRYREPFGLVALEALTSGLPVLVSDYAMIADEVVDGGFGLSCDPHDEAGFAFVLQRLAGDDALVAAMSRKAHAEARRLAPTPSGWTDALLTIYGNLLQRGIAR